MLSQNYGSYIRISELLCEKHFGTITSTGLLLHTLAHLIGEVAASVALGSLLGATYLNACLLGRSHRQGPHLVTNTDMRPLSVTEHI